MITGTIDTPLGPFLVGVEDAHVTRAEFTRSKTRGSADEALQRALAEVRAYFDGDLGALDRIPVHAEGPPTARAVWEQLRLIPAGAVRTYGQIADIIGKPRAARAVGAGCATNPIGLIVPCHRVVRGDGSLGGYGFGLERKRWLLDHERAHGHNGG